MTAAAPRVTKRRAATRARLLQAATAVFAEHGFGQVSIEQICDAAGYSRGAFYSNFASPDELFFALYEQRASGLADQVAAALHEAGGDDSIPAVVDRVVRALMVDRQWVVIKTDFLLYAARHPQVATVLARQRDDLRGILAQHLTPIMDTVVLPPDLRNPDALARAVITIHDGAMLALLVDPDPQAVRKWLGELIIALLEAPQP